MKASLFMAVTMKGLLSRSAGAVFVSFFKLYVSDGTREEAGGVSVQVHMQPRQTARVRGDGDGEKAQI